MAKKVIGKRTEREERELRERKELLMKVLESKKEE